MAHRSLTCLMFAGMTPTTVSAIINMLGDDGLPNELRIAPDLMYEPWQGSRSGLLVMGMDPVTDLAKVSSLIQDRTTWWEVAVCLAESIKAYEPALLAQGAIKVIPHPEDDLKGCRDEIRNLLDILATGTMDVLGLELADLIQLYGEKRVARTIRVSGDGVIGSIFLRAGNIVHAETMDETTGMEAFSRLFRVRSPDLRIHSGCLTDKASVNMGALTVLLEGARVNDEDERDQSSIADTGPTANDINNALDDILQDFDFGGDPEPAPQPQPVQPEAQRPSRVRLSQPLFDTDLSELDLD